MNSSSLRPLAFAALALAALPLHAAISTFDLGAEGWTAKGDSAGPVIWSATGGNPDGHVRINDRVIGGVTYFVAPAAFLGNQSGALGTNLTFDLKQEFSSASDQFDERDVILRGAGLVLVYDTATNPTNGGWTSYAVPLSATGWRVNSLAGAAASTAQFASVLGNLTGLEIRAEYQTGSDTGFLDNVALVPEPGTWATMAAGLGLLGAMGWRRRGTVRSGEA